MLQKIGCWLINCLLWLACLVSLPALHLLVEFGVGRMWWRCLQQMLEARHQEIPKLPLNRTVGRSSSCLFQVLVKSPLRRPFLSTRETRPKSRPLLLLSTSHKGRWSERFGRLQLNLWFVQKPCFPSRLGILDFPRPSFLPASWVRPFS